MLTRLSPTLWGHSKKLEIYFPVRNNELGNPGYYNIVCIGKINEFNKIQLDEPKKDSIKLEVTN